jgi:hypothetical protein
MCIHFGHPTKKNELVSGSPWEVAMARLAPGRQPWGTHRTGERGGRRRGGGAALVLLGVPWRGC